MPPVIVHDFAAGVTKVVETQTAGLGPEGQVPKLAAEATCGAILSSKDILIGCDLAIRSCSPKTEILRFGPNQQSEGTGNKGDLTWRKAISDS
jgi:hypothetical protein